MSAQRISTAADPKLGFRTTPYQNGTQDLFPGFAASCTGVSAPPAAVGQWGRPDTSDGVRIGELYVQSQADNADGTPTITTHAPQTRLSCAPMPKPWWI